MQLHIEFLRDDVRNRNISSALYWPSETMEGGRGAAADVDAPPPPHST